MNGEHIMKRLLAATICTLPFAVGGTVYAQVDPSLVNAAPQSQSDTAQQSQTAGASQQDQSTAESSNSTGASTTTSGTDATTAGSAGAGTTSTSSDARTQGSSGIGAGDSDTGSTQGPAERDTNTPGSPDSMTSVAPAQPATPSTTEPGEGHNRSASGDATGTDPRGRDDQGVR